MRSAIVGITIGLALASTINAIAQPAADSTVKGQESVGEVDRFDLLADRNIFLRDRRPSQVEWSTEGAMLDHATLEPIAPLPIDPASYFVLRGVTIQGAERTAFIEDQRSGETRRFTAGDALGGGEIVAIDLDYITFRVVEDMRRIALGQRLTGKTVQSDDMAVSMPDNGATTGDGEISPANDEQESVLGRMRQRRLRELRGEEDESP